MKIIFCGPLGDSLGGGEAGNRKTIQLLTKLGFFVYLHPKPYAKNGAFFYLLAWIGYIFRFFLLLVFKRPNAVHISGFYAHLIYFECAMVLLARIFCLKVVYEIRAGGADEYYFNGGRIYRWFFSLAIKFSSHILCQGKVYLEFLRTEFGRHGVYYPNFVLSDCYDRFGRVRSSSDFPRLVFVGRIVREKNIDLILEVVAELQVIGIPAEAVFVGAGDSSYVAEIKALAFHLGVVDRIIFSGVRSGDDLYEEINKCHIFIFPTKEPREGHSNALTEAMACGLVPVVSDHGFNRDVVGDDSLVVENFSARSFAELIAKLWTGGDFDKYSNAVRARVGDLYVDRAVIEKLRFVYSFAG